jgi:hypothetical protein
MPFLATNIEAHPAPLPVMASGGDRDKRPWGGAPTMMDLIVGQVRFYSTLAICVGLLLVVTLTLAS